MMKYVSDENEDFNRHEKQDDGDADDLLPLGLADAGLEFLWFIVFHAEGLSLRTLTAVP
jgi:hypothetical protein